MGKKAVIAVFVVVILSLMPFAASYYGGKIAERRINAFITGLNIPYKSGWQSLSYNPFTRRMVITGFYIGTPEEITVSKVVVDTYSRGVPLPESLSLDISGLIIPVTEQVFGRYFTVLKRMGIFSLECNTRFTMGSNGKEIYTSLENAVFKGLGVFNAYALMESENLTYKNVENRKLLKASVHFADDGLAKRVIDLLASDLKVSPENAKNRLLTGLNNRLRLLAQSSGLRKNYVQLYRYFDDPRKITVRLNDGADIAMGELLPPKNLSGWRKTGDWAASLPVDIDAD